MKCEIDRRTTKYSGWCTDKLISNIENPNITAINLNCI